MNASTCKKTFIVSLNDCLTFHSTEKRIFLPQINPFFCVCYVESEGENSEQYMRKEKKINNNENSRMLCDVSGEWNSGFCAKS